jgi:hypothetical protein
VSRATTTYRATRGDVRTVWIGRVGPELDGGRFPVKREVGEWFASETRGNATLKGKSGPRRE